MLDRKKFWDTIRYMAQLERLNASTKPQGLSMLEAVLEERSSMSGASDQAMINDLVSFLEEAIDEESALTLTMSDGKQPCVFPRKVVFMEGGLCLIAEGVQDNCLLSIPVDEIKSAAEEDVEWKKIFSKFEIEDFISGLRLVTESEVRLVLKIYSQKNFNSNIKQHYFANQCMFTNPYGDFIWAASIEPSEEIYQWLAELGSDVEILDPTDFKKDFLKYCEGKLNKIA